MKKLILIISAIVGLVLAANLVAFASAAGDEIPVACQSCSLYTAEKTEFSQTAAMVRMAGICLVVIAASLYGWRQYKKKLYLVLGAAAVLAVGGSYLYAIMNNADTASIAVNCLESCPTGKSPVVALRSVAQSSEFTEADAEEFIVVGYFESGTDEDSAFEAKEKHDSESSSITTDDSFEEFAEFSEFETVDQLSEFDEGVQAESATAGVESPTNYSLLIQIGILLALCLLVGFGLHFKFVRNLRGVILLSSLAYLGFYTGGCPCMIMSFNEVLLFLLGHPVSWVLMSWFLGLIVVTYFGGKTWCGWLCHLGALQDFLFRFTGSRWLSSPKAQNALKYIQLGFLLALTVQVIIQPVYLWTKIDPFKVVFNVYGSNAVAFALAVLLLLSSVFVYRPFCRIVCPVGLVLGWVSKIPGARTITIDDESCAGCRRCEKQCKQHSISTGMNKTDVNESDCIACGDCIDNCRKESIANTVSKSIAKESIT